jgi:hypothetical protein
MSTCTRLQSKMDGGAYKTMADFCEDVRLIWDNCVRFNGPIVRRHMHCRYRRGLNAPRPCSGGLAGRPRACQGVP